MLKWTDEANAIQNKCKTGNLLRPTYRAVTILEQRLEQKLQLGARILKFGRCCLTPPILPAPTILFLMQQDLNNSLTAVMEETAKIITKAWFSYSENQLHFKVFI